MSLDPFDTHKHDGGLQADLSRLINRRRVLGLLAGAGLGALAGCKRSGDNGVAVPSQSSAIPSPGGTSGATDTPSGTSAAGCTEIPGETAGPYPGDGSNGPNALTQTGIVRSDITSSFGSASGVATGIPLTIKVTVLGKVNGCAPYKGAAVYLWHCNIDGAYSLYDSSIRNENYLRGVQEADANGVVRFKSIYPAAYSGRWPHIHFEVYPSLAKAMASADRIATSQIALPETTCHEVYATTPGYSRSIQNLDRTSLARDNVFGDGYQSQLATITGSISSGLVASLSVPV